MAVLCSMWQIIRHANQAEAAVESLIIVPVSHKGPSPPFTDPDPPTPQKSILPPSHPPPFLFSPRTDRQTDGPEAEAMGGEFWRISWHGWFISNEVEVG